MGRTRWDDAQQQFRDFLSKGSGPCATVDRYILRVLGQPVDRRPGRTPTLLDISRRGDGIAAELARVGFRVTRIALEDSSLETVSERLAGHSKHFDAVVCREVLEQVDDWQEVVERAARRLKAGGVFVYGVSAGGRAGWLGLLTPRWLRARGRTAISAGDMVATLRRAGLHPREMISLGAETIEADSTAYVGHSIMRTEHPAPASTMRWDFTGTGERWLGAFRR